MLAESSCSQRLASVLLGMHIRNRAREWTGGSLLSLGRGENQPHDQQNDCRSPAVHR
ncbi:protein of unknown function [Candidatus Nitrosacidococcus tergens]|uniref:Uncharacterized protein n=1 Tax=Candidatus Nitrosacidococcus tergens TaxID=553981 RepID=A0A7G1QAY2_9GAMM|nr:protein of unknown function [Candidatus Nitrosacidococcus tergens]